MDKASAIEFLHNLILTRFPPGSEREGWLAWLVEFTHAEENLETLSGLLTRTAQGGAPPRSH